MPPTASNSSVPAFRRVFQEGDPFSQSENRGWRTRGTWPAYWVSVPHHAEKLVAAYKLSFVLPETRTFTIHVTADERYELFVDGIFVGRGSERGDVDHWFFESYELSLTAGEHVIVARVWSLGEAAPYAQMTLRHGFLLCPDAEELTELLATGIAPWTGKALGGYEFLSPLCAWGTGENTRIIGELYDWGHEKGVGEGWKATSKGVVGGRSGSQPKGPRHHGLSPAILPPMLDERREGFTVLHVSETPVPTTTVPIRCSDSLADEVFIWRSLLKNKQALEIPPHTVRRILIDLENYYCGWPEISVSAGRGSRIRIHWAEALFQDLERFHKGNRNEIEGKFFTAHESLEDGVGDEFLPDGGPSRSFVPLWWQAGRYIEIHIQTGEEPLIFESFAVRETRYPLEMEGSFACSDASLEAIVPMMVRSLQMCSHETYMDCPFYEQLMYVGDTRLEILVTYVLTRDDKLPRKALKLFDLSRVRSGLTQSRYPSRVRQVIPPFSLWWVTMCHDYALWRGDAAFVRSLLPGVRTVCDHFAELIGEDGLMRAPDGWNFTDWVKNVSISGGWSEGVPPNAAHGVSGILNWHVASTFRQASELETWFGDGEVAALQMRRARTVAQAVDQTFWNEERDLYADDVEHRHWSEHTQCLALLSGFVPEEKYARLSAGLLSATDLVRTTIYFSFYLFEAYRLIGRVDHFLKRLSEWNKLLENGLKTTIEQPEPTRSDCHAWGAHPLFHFFATLAGIRPTAPGFTNMDIEPQLGPLQWMKVKIPHPQGEIELRVQDNKAFLSLPDGINSRLLGVVQASS